MDILQIFKDFSSKSQFDFNERLLIFLNYIKLKTTEETTSLIISNSLIDFEKATISQILTYLKKSKVGNLEDDLNSSRENEKTINNNDQYNIIIDLEGYINKTQSVKSEDNSQTQTIKNHEKILKNLKRLKNLGTLIILCDYFFMSTIQPLLTLLFENEPNTNFLIKAVIAHKSHMISFLSFQKFELKSKVNQNNLKIHFAETIISNNSLNKDNKEMQILIEKIGDLTIKEICLSYEYLLIINEISLYLRKRQPGKTIKVEIKKVIWTETIDYTAYITDSNDENLQKLNTISTFLVTSSYANDFIYISGKGREGLCGQSLSSRVILIRPSYFNNDSHDEMKKFLLTYSGLFAFDEVKSNKFLSLSDSNSTIYEIYNDEKFIIRDVKDITKKDYYRQLIYKEIPNEIDSEVRLYNVNEIDSKSLNYITVKTNKFFKSKKEKSCIDPYMIISHFNKVCLSSMHFVDNSRFNIDQSINTNKGKSTFIPFEILVIGGSIGTLPFFMKKTFNSLVNITVLEKNQSFQKLSEEYFGLRGKDNDDSSKWEYSSNYVSYIQSIFDKRTSNKKRFFDIIIINENNFYKGETLSPSPEMLSKGVLEMFKVSI